MVNSAEATGLDFPGKEPSEEYRFYFRQHWARLIPPLFKAFFWSALLFLSSILSYVGLPLDDTVRHMVLIPLTLIFLLFQMQLMRKWYEYFLHVVIVTDTKIHRMKKRFLLTEHERSVDIASIRDVRREQHGAIQPLLSFGTLELDTAQGEIMLHFTPRLREIHDALIAQRDNPKPAPQPPQEKMLEDVKTAVETLKPYTEGGGA